MIGDAFNVVLYGPYILSASPPIIRNKMIFMLPYLNDLILLLMLWRLAYIRETEHNKNALEIYNLKVKIESLEQEIEYPFMKGI